MKIMLFHAGRSGSRTKCAVYKRPLIDPRLFARLHRFLPHTAVILKRGEDQTDEWGQAQPNDQADFIPLHEGIECQVVPDGGNEVRDEGSVYGLSTHVVILTDVFNDIAAGMKAEITDQNGDVEHFRVLLPEIDSQRHQTRLQVEKRVI